jgi:hypothetical protein
LYRKHDIDCCGAGSTGGLTAFGMIFLEPTEGMK